MVTKELVSAYICSNGKRFYEKEDAVKYEEGLNSIVEHYNDLGDLELIEWQFFPISGAYERN